MRTQQQQQQQQWSRPTKGYSARSNYVHSTMSKDVHGHKKLLVSTCTLLRVRMCMGTHTISKHVHSTMSKDVHSTMSKDVH